MSFSRLFLDEIKRRIDIVDYIGHFTELEKLGDGVWGGQCPHPDHNDSSPSFRVWEKHQSWACMGCHSGPRDQNKTGKTNFGSDCFAFVQWMEKVDWKTAVEILAKEAGLSIESDPHQEKYDANMRAAMQYHRSMTPIVRTYLMQRGMSKETIAEWLIGVAGDRISFPLFDQYGRVLGFSSRKIPPVGPKDLKYVNSANSEVFHKGAYLYGMNKLDQSCGELRITEGTTDVVLPRQRGVKNVVATLGCALNEQHVPLIVKSKLVPVLCYDPDTAGKQGTLKAIETLSKNGIWCKVFVPPGGDLDEWSAASPDPEAEIKNSAVLYWQYLLEPAVRQYHRSLAELRMATQQQVELVMSQLVRPAERSIMANYLRDSVGYDPIGGCYGNSQSSL